MSVSVRGYELVGATAGGGVREDNSFRSHEAFLSGRGSLSDQFARELSSLAQGQAEPTNQHHFGGGGVPIVLGVRCSLPRRAWLAAWAQNRPVVPLT